MLWQLPLAYLFRQDQNRFIFVRFLTDSVKDVRAVVLDDFKYHNLYQNQKDSIGKPNFCQ